MSLAYLEELLPLQPADPEPSENTSLENKESATENPPDLSGLLSLSDHQLGVLSSRFERFADKLKPYRETLTPVKKCLEQFDLEIHRLLESLHALQGQLARLLSGLDEQRTLVERLNPLLLDMAVPPAVVRSIVSEPLDQKWVESLHFITEKRQLAERLRGANELLRAFQQLEVALDLLEKKAVEKVRNHMIQQIRLLRKSPLVSSQAVQQHLLKVKDAFAFLRSRAPGLAAQLHTAYSHTMRWYYTLRFAKYLYLIQKIKVRHIDALYVLGGSADDTKQTFLGLNYTQPVPQGPRTSVAEYFALAARRMSALNDELRQAIPTQIAETSPFAYWLEFVYLQFANAVLDNVIVEYLFVVDFFFQGEEKFGPVSLGSHSPESTERLDWARLTFEKVFEMGTHHVHWLVSSPAPGTCDSYAVLLMIRITQNHMALLHNQFHVPIMDEYHNALLLSLWPVFTKTIDTNCDAIKKNTPRARSTSHAPVPATQHFAQYMVGLLRLAFVLDDNLYQGEPICMLVVRLRNDFEGALTKASTYIFGSSKNKTATREMFLFNNYFLIVTILRNEFDTPHEFVTEQIQHFEMLCEAYKPK